MENALKLAEKLGARYAETISLDATRTHIELTDKKTKELSHGSGKIFAVRVLTKGWGVAYSNKEEFAELVKTAIKNANEVDINSLAAHTKPVRKRIVTKCRINPANVSLEEKQKQLLELAREKIKYITNLKLNYTENISNYTFANTEGTMFEWADTIMSISAIAYAKEGNRREEFLEIERGKCGYEIMEKAEGVVKEATKKAIAMLKAKNAKGGIFPVVVDHKLGGVFAHEAVGHACEADMILTNSSILKDKMGQKIGSDIVSITDNGLIEGWGWVPIDNEGCEGRRTELISKGVMVGLLHSRETAALLDAEPTGNGRSEGPDSRPIPRMTTTYIENGDSSFEEIIAQIKKGYYLKGSKGGQVDPAGGDFLFNAQEGYLIENGELKHMVKGVSLIGNILKTLHDIILVADDLKCIDTGYCGKAGQMVPVVTGAPHVLIENAKVGGI